MSKTVSELLVAVLEQIDVKPIFGLIGDSINRLPMPSGTATSNGLAFGMRKAPRRPPPVRPN